MRITEIKGATSASSVKKKGRDTSATGFNELLGGAEETPTTTNLAGVGALTSLDGLLALQEVDNGPTIDEENIAHGAELLDILDELKLSLLDGQIDPRQVNKMLDETRKHYGQTNDPKLRTIIDDIELRAEIELAKIEFNRT